MWVRISKFEGAEEFKGSRVPREKGKRVYGFRLAFIYFRNINQDFKGLRFRVKRVWLKA